MRTETTNPVTPGYNQPGAGGGTGYQVDLLPAPLGTDLDAITQMYALLMADSKHSTESKMDDVKAANEQRAAELEKRIAEIKAAMKELEDGGFWEDLGNAFGDVAKWVGVVAAVALTVSTAGAGGPAAALAISALVLSSAAMLESETGCISGGLVKAGVISEDQAKWVGPALAVLGAACSCGAAGVQIFGSAATVAHKASTMTQLARTTGNVASIVAGSTSVIAGGAQIAYADVERDAKRHEANAAEAMMRMQMLQQIISQLVEDLESVGKRETSLTNNMVQISELHASSMMTLASGKA